MKKMSSVLLVVFTGLSVAGPIKDHRLDLGLTAEQQKQMHLVKQSERARMQKAREDIRAQSKIEMAQFLTPEQMEKLASLQQHKQQHAQMRKGQKNKRRIDKRPKENN